MFERRCWLAVTAKPTWEPCGSVPENGVDKSRISGELRPPGLKSSIGQLFDKVGYFDFRLFPFKFAGGTVENDRKSLTDPSSTLKHTILARHYFYCNRYFHYI